MISITLGQGVSKITIPAIIHISNLIYEAQKESGIFFGKAIIIGYILEIYMPQAEFEEHLKKYNRE